MAQYYYNSTVKRKEGKCTQCVEEGDEEVKYLTGKLCQKHHQAKKKAEKEGAEDEPQTNKTATPRSPIKPVSDKLAKELRRYAGLRVIFLGENTECQMRVEGYCTGVATEIHHPKGRGKYLNVVSLFMAVCRGCHQWELDNSEEARRRGFTILRTSDQEYLDRDQNE